ncbi:MmcQ/YjbR family DNA-binding protein [Streptococcus dentiloxodontae]
MRHHRNNKILAIIYEQDSRLLVNLKLQPQQIEELLSCKGVVAGIGLNKKHWISIFVNEAEINQSELEQMILISSQLTIK